MLHSFSISEERSFLMRSLNISWKNFDQIVVVWGGGHKYFFIVSAQRTLFHQKHYIFVVLGRGQTTHFCLSFWHREHNFTKKIFVVYPPPSRNYKFTKDVRIKRPGFNRKERKKEGRKKGRKKGKKEEGKERRKEGKKEGRKEGKEGKKECKCVFHAEKNCRDRKTILTAFAVNVFLFKIVMKQSLIMASM